LPRVLARGAVFCGVVLGIDEVPGAAFVFLALVP
jgi:hypothetical protein